MTVTKYKLLAISLFLLCLLLCAVTSGSRNAESSAMNTPRPLVAVIPADLPPTYFLDKSGKPIGFAIDVLDGLALRSGLTVKYENSKGWDDAIQMVLDGKADLIPSLTIDEQRKELLAFTDPVDLLLVNLIVASSNDKVHGISPGLTIGVLKGSAPHNFLKKNQEIRIETFNDLQTMLFELLAGHLDGIVSLTSNVMMLATDAGVDDKIKVIGKPIIEAKRGVALRKEDSELLTILDKAIEDFIDSPEYRQIYVKWYGKPKPWWTATRIGAVSGMLLFSIVSGMAFWRYRSIVRLNEILTCSVTERKLAEEALREGKMTLRFQNDQLLATEEMLRMQIEEFQATQKLLNESNTNLKTLFNLSPLAIVVCTFPEGIVREINNTFSDDFGYTYECIVGKTGVEVGFWADTYELDHFLNLIHEKQDASGFGIEIQTFNGAKRNVLLSSTLMNFKEEKCLLSVFMDVTEQKLMEDQIRQSHKMDIIGQLAGGIAHDFNNMLTAIIGSAELMKCYIVDFPAPMKLLGNIQEAAARSADLTQQLLTFSRKEQKNCTQVCMNKTINSVISLLDRTVDKKITLETRLDAKNAMVIGDSTFLQNALLNLGVNARDAMQEGGVITFMTLNVELDSSFCASRVLNVQPGQFLEISVSDTGVGMSKNVVERIFEPFFTTKEAGKGTGLGLAAVYNTVKEHNGSICVLSKAGLGTVFKLYLPLYVGEQTIRKASAEVIRATGGGRILLVDDEQLIRHVGCEILQNIGYQVLLAEDGEQALEVYARENENISLVILDMIMPKMGGKETYERLKESYPNVRVLIASGFSQSGALDSLKDLEIKGFIQKPFNQLELGNAVAVAIAG